MEGFSFLLEDTKLADVTFVVHGGNEEIHAHRAVLAGRCDYFRCMFTGGFREAAAHRIPLPHIRGAVFRQLLEYLYTNSIRNVQYAVELCAVADEFQVPGLKEIALDALQKALFESERNRRKCRLWEEATLWLSNQAVKAVRETLSKRVVLRWNRKFIGKTMELSEFDTVVESHKEDDWKENAISTFAFTSGRHSFEIHVLAKCNAVWVGVATEDINMDSWLGKQAGGWVYGAGSICHATQQNNGPYKEKYGRSLKKGDVVKVTVDMDKRILSFATDGEDHGVAFSNLPSKVFAAVSLSKPGKVKICNYHSDLMEIEE